MPKVLERRKGGGEKDQMHREGRMEKVKGRVEVKSVKKYEEGGMWARIKSGKHIEGE